jgi:hypothetical protein
VIGLMLVLALGLVANVAWKSTERARTAEAKIVRLERELADSKAKEGRTLGQGEIWPLYSEESIERMCKSGVLSQKSRDACCL